MVKKYRLTQRELHILCALTIFKKAYDFRRKKQGSTNEWPEQFFKALTKDKEEKRIIEVIDFKSVQDGWITRQELAMISDVKEQDLAVPIKHLIRLNLVEEDDIVYKRTFKKEELRLRVDRLRPLFSVFQYMDNLLFTLQADLISEKFGSLKNNISFENVESIYHSDNIPSIYTTDFVEHFEKDPLFLDWIKHGAESNELEVGLRNADMERLKAIHKKRKEVKK